MSSTDLPCPVVAATPGDAQHFVGFHDVCPWAPTVGPEGEELAVLRIPAGFERTPLADDVAEVCLWFPASGAMRPVAETRAWNLQQGARTQWRPGRPRTLLWNDRRGDRFVGVELDLTEGRPHPRDLAAPLYALHPTGRWSLAPGFARLNRYYPSYGYAGGTGPGLLIGAPQSDGIWRLDLDTGEQDLLVSVDRAAGFAGLIVEPPVPHFLTHPAWNPSGTRFCFIHRYFTAHGEMMSRLFVCDSEGRDLTLLSDDRVSHFDWRDDDTLCVWARIGLRQLGELRNRGLLASPLVRPLVTAAKRLRPDLKRRLNNAGYWTFDVTRRRAPKLIGERMEDGHQMFSPDRRWMLTDTYPDADLRQNLMLFDLERDSIYTIARLPAPAHADHDHRCDLHPRWNRDGTMIAVDSDGAGVRQVLLIDPAPVFAAAAEPPRRRTA